MMRFLLNMLTEFLRRLFSSALSLLFRFRHFLFLSLLLLLIPISLYFLAPHPYTHPPSYSIFNEEWDGLSLLHSRTSSMGAKALLSIDDLSMLHGSGTLLIINPISHYSATEKQMIKEYVKDGGTIIIAGTTPSSSDLASEFGVRMGNATLVDYLSFSKRQDVPLLPFTVNGTSGFLLSKFPTIIYNYPQHSKIIIASSPHSYLDLNSNMMIDSGDLKGPFAVGVSFTYDGGRVVVIGDSDIFTNDLITKAGNSLFALSLLNSPPFFFDESHHAGEKSYPLLLLLSFRTLIRSPSFLSLLLPILLIILSLSFYLSFPRKREEAIPEKRLHEYRDLVWDIVRNARLRPEPYLWMVLMQYDRLRDRLLMEFDPFKKRMENRKLARLASQRYGWDEMDLRSLLDRCDDLREGRVSSISFTEANELCRRMRSYITKLSRRRF